MQCNQNGVHTSHIAHRTSHIERVLSAHKSKRELAWPVCTATVIGTFGPLWRWASRVLGTTRQPRMAAHGKEYKSAASVAPPISVTHVILGTHIKRPYMHPYLHTMAIVNMSCSRIGGHLDRLYKFRLACALHRLKFIRFSYPVFIRRRRIIKHVNR